MDKWNYAWDQCAGPSPFVASKQLPGTVEEVLLLVSACFLLQVCVVEAIKWVAARTAEEVVSEREEMISCLEQAADAMTVNGLKQKWFEGADKHTRAVAGQANGHLMSVLLEASGYCDAGCVELLREGC